MIKATSSINGPPLTFNATVSGLAIYLDNFSLISLAKGDPSRRQRFVDAINTGVDLLFSVTNAAELTGPQGQSLEAVRTFLDQVGPHWFPVELDPFEVANREMKGATPPESCFSQDFMKQYFVAQTSDYSPDSGRVIELSEQFFRLGAVLDWVASERDSIREAAAALDNTLINKIGGCRIKCERDPRWLERFSCCCKSAVLSPLRGLLGSAPRNPTACAVGHRIAPLRGFLRMSYSNERTALDQRFPALPFNPAKPATFTCVNLVRTLLAEARAYQLKKGDGLDFSHAAIGSAFANLATLDKHWKRRVEGLPKPNKLARIYYQPELDKMVADIESWVKSEKGRL